MLDVLLVDDEPSIRLSVGDALQAAGYRVTLAADGGEAADLVTTRVFDVVVSDIRLPKLDGLSLFRKIRADFDAKSVDQSDHQIRRAMEELMAAAVNQIETETKG